MDEKKTHPRNIANIGDLIVDQAVNELIAVRNSFTASLGEMSTEKRTLECLKKAVRRTWFSKHDGMVGGSHEEKLTYLYESKKEFDGFEINLDMWWTGNILEAYRDGPDTPNFCITFYFYHSSVCTDSHFAVCDVDDFFNDQSKWISVDFKKNITEYCNEALLDAETHKEEFCKYEADKKQKEIGEHYIKCREYEESV